MIKILENVLHKFLQKHLAMGKTCYGQQWRVQHDMRPIRDFKAELTEEAIVAKEQVKYDLVVSWGREMYCMPEHIDLCLGDLFKSFRHECFGDLISDVYNIRSMLYAGSTKDALEALDQLLKDLGE